MPDVDAIIQHGNLPDAGTLVDEADVLVQSLTVTPSREEKYFKGTNRADQGYSATNPKLTFAYKAIVSEYAGFADQHPGTAVAELANFAAAKFGFDPTQGMMIYKDPSLDLDNDNPDMVNFTVEHNPFIEPAVV